MLKTPWAVGKRPLERLCGGSNLYSDIKLRLSHKRLMIFTCRDDPHGGDGAKDRQARTKAADLKETGRFNRRVK